MRQTRPKNLNLFTIRFPLPAIVSILHRISGVFLFVLIPIALWLLSYSLSENGFATIKNITDTFYFKGAVMLFFIPFILHLVAGVRHLISDLGIGTSLCAGRLSAQVTLILTILFILSVGIWLW